MNEIMLKSFNENLLNDFFTFLDVSEKTLITYRGALKQLFLFFYEHKISMPVYDDIILFKKELELKGCKAATVALYLAAARRFFSWCEMKGFYPNVASGVKAHRTDKGHKKDYLGAAQLKTILHSMKQDTLKEKRDFAIIFLMSVCGLRTVEVVRANVEDLRTLGDFTVLFVQGKGRKDKTEFVKIPEPLENAIREYLSARNERFHDYETKNPLFTSTSKRNRNQRMTPRSIRGIAKSVMRSAGFDSKRLSAHSLRHSAVTLALLGGMSLSEVQALARHSDISTTQIYVHNVERLNSKCEDVVCSMIY